MKTENCKKCGAELKAKYPSKKGKTGLCHACAVKQPFDETHKLKISDSLTGRVRTVEHCANIGKAALERYKDPSRVPWWKGGKSFEPYPPKFNEKLKEAIRKRDGYRCQECFRHQNELGRKLDVHHIDYDKRNCSLDNLISLCATCHNQTNYSREDWEEYYQKRLEEGGTGI